MLNMTLENDAPWIEEPRFCLDCGKSIRIRVGWKEQCTECYRRPRIVVKLSIPLSPTPSFKKRSNLLNLLKEDKNKLEEITIQYREFNESLGYHVIVRTENITLENLRSCI